MSSQITIQDVGGIHNSNLKQSRARIMRGGSWKRQNMVVIIPAAETINAKVCLAWMNLAFPPNNGVVRILAQGMEVGHAYSSAIESIIEHPELSKFQYILCIEHDNLPPSDGVLRLLEAMEEHPELAAIGGLYFTKYEGGVPQIWGDPKDPVLNYRPQPPDPNGGLVECCGTGQGFTMFRLDVFKDSRIPKPWFETKKDSGGISTQDLAFWSNARKFGYRCGIHCGIKVGHIDSNGVVW